MEHSKTVVKAGAIAIIVNLLLAIFKIFVGSVSNSVAVTSDALHGLVDTLSGAIVIISEKLGSSKIIWLVIGNINRKSIMDNISNIIGNNNMIGISLNIRNNIWSNIRINIKINIRIIITSDIRIIIRRNIRAKFLTLLGIITL